MLPPPDPLRLPSPLCQGLRGVPRGRAHLHFRELLGPGPTTAEIRKLCCAARSLKALAHVLCSASETNFVQPHMGLLRRRSKSPRHCGPIESPYVFPEPGRGRTQDRLERPGPFCSSVLPCGKSPVKRRTRSFTYPVLDVHVHGREVLAICPSSAHMGKFFVRKRT